MKTTKYMSLQCIDLNTIDEDEIAEALAEFGIEDTIIDGNHYPTSHNLKALAQMMHTLDLPGSIMEVTGIYDSKETTTESFIL